MKSNSYINELKKHIGQKRDYLEIIGVEQYGKKSRLVVRCICGNIKEMTLSRFNNTAVHSCGCIGSRKGKESPNYKHGFSRTRIYNVYRDMYNRCYNMEDVSYSNYGARGISICDEWLGKDGIQNFCKWAYENGYDDKAKRGNCTIDRIDVNKSYCSENCRWETAKKQSNNKRNNRYYEVDGVVKTLSEWCDEYKIDCVQTVHGRLKRGMDIKTALTKPIRKKLSEMTEEELEQRKQHKLEAGRKWRSEHKEQIQLSREKWIKNNPEKNKESKKRYEEKKKRSAI